MKIIVHFKKIYSSKKFAIIRNEIIYIYYFIYIYYIYITYTYIKSSIDDTRKFCLK